MPFWLQLVTAVSAGLVSALLGIALVPYLQKLRMFPPQEPSESGEAAGEERRPIMGGILILAGTAFSFILSLALYLQFGDCDRTSAAFSSQTDLVRALGVYCLPLCAVGILCDWQTVRGRFDRKYWNTIRIPIVLIAAILAMLLGRRTDAGLYWYMALLPAAAAVCFQGKCGIERKIDGLLIPASAVELLVLTVILLKKDLALPAITAMAAAGASLGSMLWCLHPAKCRMGRTGMYFLAAIVPMLCLLCGLYRELALCMAVPTLQQGMRLLKKEPLTDAMQNAGMKPEQIMTILTALTAFCGVMALLLK